PDCSRASNKRPVVFEPGGGPESGRPDKVIAGTGLDFLWRGILANVSYLTGCPPHKVPSWGETG
ncbi:MAG: hypothetical protein ACYSWU_28905, partial [Planctomycetota bacterium]